MDSFENNLIDDRYANIIESLDSRETGTYEEIKAELDVRDQHSVLLMNALDDLEEEEIIERKDNETGYTGTTYNLTSKARIAYGSKSSETEDNEVDRLLTGGSQRRKLG